MNSEMKGGFAGALNYFMDIRKVTAEELQGRAGVSIFSTSKYKNNLALTIENGTALALCKGISLLDYEVDIFFERAGCPIYTVALTNVYVRDLIEKHMDDTWEQWGIKLKMF